MSLKISSNRIYATDVAGTGVIFDTGAGMFRSLSFVDTFVDMPSRTATSTSTSVTSVNADVTYTVASVDASCTDILGMVQLSRSAAGGAPNTADPAGRWTPVSGSLLDIEWWCGPQSSLRPETDLTYRCAAGWITFSVSGGVVYMREEITIRAPQSPSGSVTYTSTRPATRVFCRLYCGSFV